MTERTVECGACHGKGKVPDPAIYLAGVRCLPSGADPQSFAGEAHGVRLRSSLCDRGNGAVFFGAVGHGIVIEAKGLIDERNAWERAVLAAFPVLAKLPPQGTKPRPTRRITTVT